jgi:hypothetical protein
MRTLSTVLTRLQQSKGARPVINVTIDPDGTPATYTINHLLKMDEDEEPYRQYATLLYQNAGGAFTNVNYKGKKAIISMGYSLNGEEFTSALPPMWIMSQELQSSQGKLQCELKLKGIPDLLYDDRASQHYYSYIPGGNLANGTGTATGTPVSLKEGINTVAVTAVGTFTVELNEDTTGIATGDGVCIVSGGTQVLVSGTNIITTTGSPGNITITLGSVKYNLTIQQLLTEQWHRLPCPLYPLSSIQHCIR